MSERRRKSKQSGGDSPAQEHQDTVQEGYDAAREPERQGDGDPGTGPVPGSAGATDGDGGKDSPQQSS